MSNHRFLGMSAVAAIGAAALATISSSIYAGQEWGVSTSGATALGSFTRGNSNANAPVTGTYSRSTVAVGIDFTLGTKNYNANTALLNYAGIWDPAVPQGTEPSSTDDRFHYSYRESGSVQGVLDVADSNGLLTTSSGPTRPGDPASSLFLWKNGARFNSVSTGYSSGTIPNTISATPNNGQVNGRNYKPDGTAETTQNGQDFVRIGWSDVKFQQAFSVGTSGGSHNKTPTQTGYGLGNGNIGGTNFQRMRASEVIIGGIDASTTRLRNEDVAVIPFNLVASPGTGLAQVTKEEGKWLQATGRLSNGANFNSVTREYGSGTRNQGDNNLGLDASWGGGERDRRSKNASPITGFKDANGNPVTINLGDEMKPELSITGSTITDNNEHRVGPQLRFSDKISGSSGVRATVVAGRMGVGILSGGDSRDTNNGNALVGAETSGGVPLRPLKIRWSNNTADPFTQATAANISSGAYQMWSSAQAVTVAPYANPTANDTGANAYKPINGDVNDQTGTTITNNSVTTVGSQTGQHNIGVHRKFLNNITQSVNSFSTTGTSFTPADFIINGGFMLPQTVAVSKNFDGDTSYGVNPSYNAALAASLNGVGGASYNQTNWANPSNTNGGITNGDTTSAVKYRIYASANNANSTTANKTIDITTRTNLAGDFNGDSVRDYSDTAALALAYASPMKYVNTLAAADPDGFNYNGVAVQTRTAIDGSKPILTQTTNGAAVSITDGLLVLSDFNSNGNVTTDANNGTFAHAAIERADVRYFLYGATVDTLSFTGDNGTVYNGGNVPNAQTRREQGVRLGALKKNAAIDLFNTTLDNLVDTDLLNPTVGKIDGFTQSQANALKFEKRDVNSDGIANFYDAALVDHFDSKNITNIDHQLIARVAYSGFDAANNTGTNKRIYMGTGNSEFINLVDVELNDDTAINAADVTIANAALTGAGTDTWDAGNSYKTGPNTIVFNRTSSTVSHGTGAKLVINGGTVENQGADVFTNGVNSIDVETAAAGTFKVSNGSTTTIANITGTGSTSATGTGSVLNAKFGIKQGAISVTNGAAVNIAANGGATGVTTVNTLTIDSSSKLELHNNDLVVDYGVNASSYTDVVNKVKSGVVLLGGTGNGIASAEVDAQTIGGTMLAVVDNGEIGGAITSLSGFDIANPATTVLVKYTWFGDSNLDGVVDSSDYALVDTGFTSGGTLGGWVFGDYDYSGVVDASDYALIDTGFISQTGALPEPTTLGLLGLGAIGMLRRRRQV